MCTATGHAATDASAFIDASRTAQQRKNRVCHIEPVLHAQTRACAPHTRTAKNDTVDNTRAGAAIVLAVPEQCRQRIDILHAKLVTVLDTVPAKADRVQVPGDVVAGKPAHQRADDRRDGAEKEPLARHPRRRISVPSKSDSAPVQVLLAHALDRNSRPRLGLVRRCNEVSWQAPVHRERVVKVPAKGVAMRKERPVPTTTSTASGAAAHLITKVESPMHVPPCTMYGILPFGAAKQPASVEPASVDQPTTRHPDHCAPF